MPPIDDNCMEALHLGQRASSLFFSHDHLAPSSCDLIYEMHVHKSCQNPRCKGHVEGSTDGVDFFIFYFWNKISRTCKSYNLILICDKTCAPKLGNVPKLDTIYDSHKLYAWNENKS